MYDIVNELSFSIIFSLTHSEAEPPLLPILECSFVFIFLTKALEHGWTNTLYCALLNYAEAFN